MTATIAAPRCYFCGRPDVNHVPNCPVVELKLPTYHWARIPREVSYEGEATKALREREPEFKTTLEGRFIPPEADRDILPTPRRPPAPSPRTYPARIVP